MVVAMLSVGSRRSNGGGGGRFGENGVAQQQGQMEENELEEGETCLYNDFNNHFDPDVEFSYIDERLQGVLGHFQKDFEGVVSSQTLGSKYGHYGSFLPVHQRSPSVLLQPKTPAIVQHSTQKSSNEGIVERIRSAAASLGNSVVPKKSTSSSINMPGSATVAVDMANKEEMAINNTRGSKEMSPSKKGSVVKNASGNDQKKFTFRIKVPPDSLQRSKNSAIYSGLGLENSPSSSLEDSADDRDELSPSDEYSSVRSPMSIVQIMTSHKLPGGFLLSPMHEDLGKLAEGDDQDFPCDAKNRASKRESHEIPPINRNEFDVGKDFQGSKEMKARSDEKQRKYAEVKKEIDMESGKHSTNDLKKDLDLENKMGRELGSSSLKAPVKPTSNDYHYERSENEIMNDPGKEKLKISNLSKEIVKGTSKEKISRADIPKDEHKEVDGNIDPRVMKSEGRLMPSSSKIACTQNELDQVKEEKKVVNKDTTSEAKKLAKETAKHNKKYDLSKDITGYRECNEQKDVKNDMSRDKFAGKLVSDEIAGIHKKNEKNHGSTIKKKQKDMSRKTSSTKDHSKEKSKDFTRESYKDLRNDKHSVTSEIYGESMKARNESKPAPIKDQYRDCMKDAVYEQSENRKDSLDGFRKENLKQSRFDSFERGSSRVPEREREQSVTKVAASKKLDHASIAETHVLNAVVTQPFPGGVVGADPGTVPLTSIVINDNWVQCDACEKWRLLPYGVESSSLPQKWFCRMLDWLPAMNRCDISEEHTTQALHALYLQPALGPADASRVQSQLPGAPPSAAAPDIKQAEPNHDNKFLRSNSVSGNVKKGQVQRSLLNAPSSTSLPNSLSKKSKQSSIKSKSLNDVVHQPLEQLQGSIGVTNQTVKGNEVLAEVKKLKQKDKWKLKQICSDEVGYDTGEGSTPSLKRKREGEPDTCVKIKKSKDNSSPKGNKHEIGEGLSILDKTFKDQNQTSIETDSRGTYSGLDSGKNDRRDFSAKKRKMKEWKQSQTVKDGFLEREYLKDGRIPVIEGESETEHRKEKKVKTLRLEGKESTASKGDVQLEKKGKVTKILVSSQKDLMSDGLEGQGRDGYEKENEWGQPRPQGLARRVSNGMDTVKRDTGYVQPFVAATSSSSKMSCSLKNFPNFQEVRGSPVESVSSSPMRILKVDKPSLTGRSGLGVEDLIDGNFPCLGSPRRFSDGEGDVQSDRTGPAGKAKNSCVEQPGSHESCRVVQSSLLNSGKFDDGDHRDGKDKKAYKMDRTSTDIDHLVNGANVTEQLSQRKGKERCQEKLGERHNSDSCQEGKGSREKITRVQDRERAKVALQKKGKDKMHDSISTSHEEFYSQGKDVGRRSHEGAPESHVQSPYHEVSRSSKEIADDKRTNRVDKDRRNDMDWKIKKKIGEGRKVNQFKHGLDENPEAIPSNFHTKSSRDSISKHPESGATPRKDVKSNSQHSLHQDLSRGGERASNQVLSDRNIHSESTIRDKSQSIQCYGDKPDLQGHGSGGGCLGNKATRVEGAAMDATHGELLRAPRESSRADNTNGALICHSKPPVSNGVTGRDPEGAFSSPNRREHGQAGAGNCIKEGKDLKHMGDNIKTKGGTELESTVLYFNAALKFLKGASLLEPCNAENARHGEKTQSMTMYTDTAKLCEYCALTYERNKQMAAAALAYKCMGVAHMRVVISKNSCISRDRHELQTAFQNALPGESPSSSASDVDNLNNHALMDKSSANPAKVAGSPQVAGDHVIIARHRPLYHRVLQYTNDTISAIEAFRKSDYAFSAANGSLDGANYQSAAISAVKRVMDFNFHDIDTLLHLVKLALEAIYH